MGCFEIGRHRKAHAARPRRPLLHRNEHDNGFAAFQLATPTHPGLRAADPRVINLDLPVQRLTRRVHNGPTEFVQDQPRRFVAVNPQLPL